jgi:uncharacterized protein
MNLDFTPAKWINQPKKFEITFKLVKITTEPNICIWQRSDVSAQ